MNSKMLIGGVLGGVVFFVLGWVLFGIIFADSMDTMPCMRPHDAMNIPMIAIGNLLTGLLLAHIYSRWANITTLGGGAMAAFIIGLLMYGGMDFLMYGTSTLYVDVKHLLMDIVISSVMLAVVGGVVGWWMGRK